MRHLLCLTITFLTFQFSTQAQQQADLNNTVQLTTEYDLAQEEFTLLWENWNGASSYNVFQRTPGEFSWGSAIANLPGTDTSFVVSNITPGTLQEFKVVRFGTNASAEAYAQCGFLYTPQHLNRKMILIVTELIQNNLGTEVDQFHNNFLNDGWEVDILIVAEDDPVSEVKQSIVDLYNLNPDSYQNICLLGHVPVPYSGNLNPDGHGNHRGAWPCDPYYGDMDGNWTDQSVTNTTAQQSRNHNIPGDGKFDQSSLPSTIEIPVGRIDFSNLGLFADDEIELTRKYLVKNHLFKTAQLKSIDRGIIENNFSLGEGFGQNGFRNFTTLLGRENTSFGDYDALKSETYLWSYGAGGGNFQGASGISNTTNFAQDSIQTIFTMLFGSYFGDWDSSNNFLRAALATGTTLSNVWAGRPHWHFHPMGMGATLGDCALNTMNAEGYVTGFGTRGVHIGLMGDPTLKMEYIQAASDLILAQQDQNITLNWTASPEADIDGYRIYKSEDNQAAELINQIPIDALSYIDSCVANQNYKYYVTAVKIKEGVTGSYYNESPFAIKDINISNIQQLIANFDIDINYLDITLNNTSNLGTDFTWDFGDGNSGTGSMTSHSYATAGAYTITLISMDACQSDTIMQTINVELSNTSELESYLKIYPNPFSTLIHLDTDDKIKSLQLFTIDGQQINTSFDPLKSSFDLGDLPQGIYKLDIQFVDGKKLIKKLVKTE